MHVVCTSPAVARSQRTHRTFRTLFPGCQPHSALQMTHGQSDGQAVPSIHWHASLFEARVSCRRRRHAQYVLPAAVPLTNQALRRLGGINGAIRANVIATTNSGQGVWLPKQKPDHQHVLGSRGARGSNTQTLPVRPSREHGARSCRIPERHDHRHVAPSRPGRVDTQFRCGVALALAAWTVVPRTAGPRVIEATKPIVGPNCKTLVLVPCATASMIAHFNEYDIAAIAREIYEDEARRDGRSMDEILPQVSASWNGSDKLSGIVVKNPGVPDMYDYERVSYAAGPPGGLFSQLLIPAQKLAEAVDGYVVATEVYFEPIGVPYCQEYYRKRGQEIFAVGMQTHELEAVHGVAPSNELVSLFLQNALSKCGPKSVLYISFGSFFFPVATPQLVEALVTTLQVLDLEIAALPRPSRLRVDSSRGNISLNGLAMRPQARFRDDKLRYSCGPPRDAGSASADVSARTGQPCITVFRLPDVDEPQADGAAAWLKEYQQPCCGLPASRSTCAFFA
ncbi:hypothetical protein GGX14DRAFT_643570 [Mycena pura]|uniref:Uncharacterized protein n=1 Tax=Mycena pura TaxID=153505 RepID=A0AAD6VBC9_9AGAR|nr:hypothetical protein GGX14DRAFT_643570 [Mycena pura]